MQILVLSVLLLGFSCLAVGEPSVGARDVVTKLDDVLIEVMKNAKALGYQGRVDVLTPVVMEAHDFESIAKLAIGKHWKGLNDEEKSDLVKKLVEYSIATYAAQFDAYAGEEFKFESEDEGKGGRHIVRFILKVPGEQNHNFDYMMQQVEGSWRIVNVVVDGISDLALKRAQYESVIEKDGIGKLLEKLSEKTADYAKSRAKPSL